MVHQHSEWQGFSAVFSKDLKLAFRQRAEIVNTILFFIFVITLFRLAIGPDPG
ncbi:heme exporter protein CcmB, partial [Pseudoalteromonas sp. S1649]|uniref:heme exporter protein CcmB n=1 Tax=Pseudoalteromonas sp. S1649 TaxID=579508 RepID=UPI0012888BA7